MLRGLPNTYAPISLRKVSEQVSKLSEKSTVDRQESRSQDNELMRCDSSRSEIGFGIQRQEIILLGVKDSENSWLNI
jgi:hypothetical protein